MKFLRKEKIGKRIERERESGKERKKNRMQCNFRSSNKPFVMKLESQKK